MKIAFTQSAWRNWRKLPTDIQTHLKEKLLLYCQNSLNYAIKLTDSKIGDYRFRIGDYRIIFDIKKEKIIIVAVGHRKDIYK
ncbi:MAG: type II toxin-antitoxin system RelE/ParE family toxin [Patescibacteria group bacterium]